MFQPSLEAKKKFIAWFVSNHALKRREALWILNYLLNHELLLKQVHFVEHVERTPKGMWFSTKQVANESFYFYKNGVKLNNPEQAFHDIRLNWKEDCYIEMDFDDAYLSMVRFGVLEKNDFYQSEQVNVSDALVDELASIQREVYMEQLKAQIDEAIVNGDKDSFMRLTQHLQELRSVDQE